jgi:hypothetical protein
MSMPIVKRIDQAFDRLSDEDRDVLTYVREQVHPDTIRPEGYEDVSHLVEVANQRLRHYEPKEA